MYSDFGTTLRENEPNIIFSAARSFVQKSAGILVKSEFHNLDQALEIKRIAKETMTRGHVDVFTNPKVKEVLKEISNNQMSVVTQVFGGSHLVIFLPIVYFSVETLNIVLVEEFDGTKLQDLSFQWIPLSSLTKQQFYQQYISSFNYQILSYCSDLITQKLFNDDLASDISKLSFYPDFAVLKTDNCQNTDHIYETMARGGFIGLDETNEPEQERWGFYNVYDF